jgi:alkylation response protein AidB-like acyl-CoA dehydrogenase
MDLDLTQEQEMLREMVRGVCASFSPLDTVRAMEDDPVGFPPELWKQMSELDLIGLMLPARYGGSEMSMLEGAIVYSELGRALAPTPHFVSAVMSAGALVRAGSEGQRQALLPGIVRGEQICTTAWLEPKGGYSSRGVTTSARPDGDRFRLEGVKWHVPFAAAATHMVVPARTPDDAVELFVVEQGERGVALVQQKTIAGDTQYQVTLDGAPAERIGAPGTGWHAWEDTLLEAIVLLAAQAVGAARYALDMTVQYAKDREQFDKPIGAFQAIGHYLADAATTVDGAETLVYEAAWAHASGRSVARLAPMSKLFACRTFRDVTATAQQIFGGVGFTLEYDIQLYFRRAKQWQLSWYDDRVLEEMIAKDVLDG